MKQDKDQSILDLELRRTKVKDHIQEILNDDSNIYHPDLPNITSIGNKEALTNYLNRACDYSATQYDSVQGITRYIKDDSLVRDARKNVKINKEEADSWAHKTQFYNVIRAALFCMEYHEAELEIDNIKQILTMFNQETSINKKTLEEFNGLIIEQVKQKLGDKYTDKSITKEINIALNYPGLTDTHYNVSTLIKSEDKEFVVSSLKLKGFNESIKNKLRILSQKTSFNSIDEFIAKKSADIIINSEHIKVIPTQFSRLVPGLRNAYEESVYKIQTGNKITESSRGYRSGSPAFLGDDKEGNTTDAIKTFQEQVGGKICLNSLMTPNPMAPDEQDGHKLFDNLINKDISKAYTPVNIAKILQSNDVKIFSEILDIVNSRKAEFNNKQLENEIKNIDDCNKLIKHNKKSYEMASKMRQLVHDIKRGSLHDFFSEDEKQEIPEILSFCKSGKDRTGISFQVSLDNILKTNNVSDTLNAGHQQILPGMNGGTTGAYGIKGEIAPQMPRQYRSRLFSRDTSFGNVLKAQKSSKKILYYDKVEEVNTYTATDTINSRKEKSKEVVNNFFSKRLTEYNPPSPEEKSLDKLIDYHLTQYDKAQGIKRYIQDDYLIRDAREQKIPENKAHEVHAWKTQCYNFCRAAQLILEYNRERRPLLPMNIIEKVESIENKETADEFKRDLVWVIADQIGEKSNEDIYNKISKQLELAINCSSLDDITYNVSTVMKISGKEKQSSINGETTTSDHTVIQSDIKIKGFNDELLNVFKNVAGNNLPDTDMYKWYRDHDEFKQFIARKACEKIVNAHNNNSVPVLPTQFRDIIPGLKNAYLETVDVQTNGGLETVMESYRAGLPAYKKDIELTKQALNSFNADTGSENIYMNSLLTADEKNGPSTLKKVLKTIKGSSLIELPLNIVRNIGARKVDHFDAVLKEIAASLYNKEIITKEAKKFIETDRLLPGQSIIIKNLRNNLINQNVNDLNVGKAVQTLVECRYLMNKRLSWRTYGSLDNNKLANTIQMAMYDIQNGSLKDYIPEKLRNTAILTFCKSGKDRTGTVFQSLVDQSLIRKFGNTYKDSIIDATINGGQQAYLSGSGGGTIGAFGIKNEGGLNTYTEYKERMVTDLATYGNRSPKYKKKEANEDDLDDISINSLTSDNLENFDTNQKLDKDEDSMSELTIDDDEFIVTSSPNYTTIPFGSENRENSALLSDDEDPLISSNSSIISDDSSISAQHNDVKLNQRRLDLTGKEPFEINSEHGDEFIERTSTEENTETQTITSFQQPTIRATDNAISETQLQSNDTIQVQPNQDVNQTLHPTITPINKQQAPKEPAITPIPEQNYDNDQPQRERPSSPRSVADYDYDYDDDYDYPRYNTPQPNYYPPQQQQSNVTQSKIIAGVVFCLAMSLLFGGLGFMLGIAVTAAALELTKPAPQSFIPPKTFETRERGVRGLGKGKEIHEISRSNGHAKRLKDRSHDGNQRGM